MDSLRDFGSAWMRCNMNELTTLQKQRDAARRADAHAAWARAWDSLPVGERMPSFGLGMEIDGHFGDKTEEQARIYIMLFMQHPERIQIDRITVEE